MRIKIFWAIKTIFIISLVIGLSCSTLVAGDTITLRLSSFLPDTHFMNKSIFVPWIQQVSEKTNGRVKIKLYTGGSLGKPQDQYDMAKRGVADMTWGALAYTPGRFPLSTVMELPFMSPSAEIGSKMVSKLLAGGYLESDFKDVKILSLAMPPSYDLHSRKKLVKSLEGLKGMKMRTPSAMMGKLITKWGGVPVAMSAPEVYQSMERGVIDGIFFDPLTFMGLRCHEVSKFHTRIGISSSVLFFAMNKKTWDKLPSDIQLILDELTGEYWSVELNGKLADHAVTGIAKKLKKGGHTLYQLPPEELKKWEKSAAPVIEDWVATVESKNLPGKIVLKEAQRLKEIYMQK